MSAFLHVAPPTYVTAPAFQPHRFGLFSVANMVDRPEPYWQTGVQYEPISCWGVSGASGICFDPDAQEPMPHGWPLSVFQGGVDTVTALPFAVYGWYDCSGMSRPLQEAEDRARAHLAAGEEREVEWSIVDGAWDNTPFLEDNPDDLGGPYPIEVAFGALEGWVGARFGGQGVIHMPRSLGPVARSKTLFSRQGQRLETELGNLVAAGSGYDMAGLGLREGADTATLFVTSVPTIRRSEVWVNPDPEFRPSRTNNDLTIYAWRVYLVSWECVTAKVEVEIPVTCPCPPASSTLMRALTTETTGAGEGTIELDPPAVDGQYPHGSYVQVTAVPAEGSVVGNPVWLGGPDLGDENANPVTVLMDQDRHMIAMFNSDT
jgi:hypothetical protein